MHPCGDRREALAFLQACGEGAGAVIRVPVKHLGAEQALRGIEAERHDLTGEEIERREPLAALDQAEFRSLLDAGDQVGAGIGQPDDLRLAGLRAQQEGGEIGRRREGIAGRAQHLAARPFDEGGPIGFHRMAEGVIGGDEEPGIAAAGDDRPAGGVRQHPGVVDPVHRIRRTLRAGQF